MWSASMQLEGTLQSQTSPSEADGSILIVGTLEQGVSSTHKIPPVN